VIKPSNLLTDFSSGVIGFVRSFGKYLPEEGITLNAVCPNVVRTNISTSVFYDKLEDKRLLTPMEPVVEAFENFLDKDISGECLEAGPKGNLVRREPAEHLDRESALVMEMLYERGHALHEPKA
jgi:NAD(P)-dependent dehydrogenase (short-subunit alcohol dehydrogenase family)